MEKFLIAGLGNIGLEYENTHHNAGFMVLDEFARLNVAPFEDKRYGSIAKTSLKGRQIFLLKPSTFMNLSGMGSLFYDGTLSRLPEFTLLHSYDSRFR